MFRTITTPIASFKLLKRYASFKQSYKHAVGQESLRYVTIGTLLEEAEAKYGDRKAVTSREQNRSLTYSQTLAQADKLAARFKTLGLEKDDRIGLWAPNLIEWYITYMACARAGLIMVGLNPNNQPPEMKYCINKVKLKAIVCADQIGTQHFYQHLVTLAPELTKCDPGKLKSTEIPSLQTIVTMGETKKKGTYNFEEVIDRATEKDITNIKQIQSRIRPDDPCSLQFTSGTTGESKVVVSTHFSCVNNGFYIGKRMDLSAKHHSICMQVPFFHAYGIVGCVITALHCGSTLVLPTPGYDPDKTIDALKEEKCTVINGTPTMYVDLVQKQKQRKENISPEIAITAAALCSPHLFQQMIEVLNLKRIHSMYGLTETSGAVFQSLAADSKEKAMTTLGPVIEHLEVKVVDENNNVVPCGTSGELCVRGFGNMIGYLDDEDNTRKAIEQGNWLRTGDQFILDEDGYGRIVGRLKEVVIRGGENIFPKEIEELLNTHPHILETYVIGLPHERLGEELCACVRVKTGSNLTLQDVTDFCKGKISHFKIPSKLRIFGEFPKTTSGKVQKFKLKESLLES